MSVGTETAPGAPAGAGTRGARVRWYWWVVGAVALLATAAGAMFSVSTISAVQELPRTVVARYLTALEHGDARGAMRLAGIKPGGGDILLTEAAYRKATDRIASFRLGAPVTRNGVTTVTATVQQGDRPYRRTFRIVRAGGLPFLPLWKLAPVPADTVKFEVAGPSGLAIDVAGVREHSSYGAVSLRALPGSYPVKVTSTDADFSVQSGVAMSHPVGVTATPAVFSAQLTDAGSAAASTAVDAWLDACLAAQEAAPPGCPFVVSEETVNGIRASDFRWTLDARPRVSVDARWSGAGFPVTGSGGSVRAAAKLTRLSDGATEQVTTEDIPFSYTGAVTFSGDGAVFTPDLADGSTQG